MNINEEKLLYLIQDWAEFISKGPIDNKPALVQIIAWRQTGNKSVSEAMLAQYNAT